MHRRQLQLMAILITLASSTSWAKEYVVDQRRCSDKGAGSAAAPFCHLGVAARRVGPGDRLLVRKGVYPERLLISTSGKVGNPIVIEGEPGAILEGQGIPLDEAGLLEVQKADHIVLRGLTIRNATFYGVLIQHARDIRLEQLTVRRSLHGGIIVNRVEDAKVINNQVIEANWLDTKTPGKSIHESITISEVVRFEVARNRVQRGIKEGIDLKDGSTLGEVKENVIERMGRVGIYINHATKLKVFDNNVHHCAGNGLMIALGDGALGPKLTADNDIYHNIVWQNGFNGVQFWQTAPGKMTRNRIYNNVFYGNKHNGLVLDRVAGNVIKNNIIAKNLQRSFIGDSVAKNIRSHNLCWGNTWDSEGEGLKVVRADPRFIKPEAGDFHLRPGSPAIDRGTKVGLPFCGKAPDIGVYEAQPR